MHCDNCADALPARPTTALVWGEAVAICQPACLHRLVRVWTPSPSPKRYATWLTVAYCALLLMAF